MKSSENHKFSDNFKGKRSEFIGLILDAKFGDNPLLAINLLRFMNHNFVKV